MRAPLGPSGPRYSADFRMAEPELSIFTTVRFLRADLVLDCHFKTHHLDFTRSNSHQCGAVPPHDTIERGCQSIAGTLQPCRIGRVSTAGTPPPSIRFPDELPCCASHSNAPNRSLVAGSSHGPLQVQKNPKTIEILSDIIVLGFPFSRLIGGKLRLRCRLQPDRMAAIQICEHSV